MGGRKDLREDPQRSRERGEGKDVAGEHDRREQEHLRDLNRFHLRPGPGGDEQPEREEREEIDDREPQQEREAPVDRHAEDHGHEEQDEEELREGESEIGKELPEHDGDGGNRRDHQLFERATFALAHDREGGEERPREGQQDRHEAGDEQVRAAGVRVEEEERVRADRKVFGPGPLGQLREGPREDQAVGRGESLARDRGVRPVDQDLDVSRLAV